MEENAAPPLPLKICVIVLTLAFLIVSFWLYGVLFFDYKNPILFNRVVATRDEA